MTKALITVALKNDLNNLNKIYMKSQPKIIMVITLVLALGVGLFVNNRQKQIWVTDFNNQTEMGGIILKVTQEKNNNYRFEVIDTGPGIHTDAHDEIFAPFRQGRLGSDKGGTGLGLAISRKKVDLMGGELKVESELKKGSNFILTLPLPPSKSDVVYKSNSAKEVVRLAEGNHVSILVVDDVEENRAVLKNLLLDVGIDVIEAVNGQDGLEKYEIHRPDLIFMDIRMPVMDGLEAIRILKENYSDEKLNIVVISASVLKHEKERYDKLGCSGVVLKPFLSEQVFAQVQDALDVEFEYEDIDSQLKSDTIDIDYSQINFSKDSIENIKKTLEIYNITQLEKGIRALHPNNQHEDAFIEEMKENLRAFDMDNINKALERLNNES